MCGGAAVPVFCHWNRRTPKLKIVLLTLCRIHSVHFSHRTILGCVGRNNINFVSVMLNPVQNCFGKRAFISAKLVILASRFIL